MADIDPILPALLTFEPGGIVLGSSRVDSEHCGGASISVQGVFLGRSSFALRCFCSTTG
jgi:hypothetical protein